MAKIRLPASKLLRLLVIIGGLLVLCMCAIVGAAVITSPGSEATRTPAAQVAEVQISPASTATEGPTATPRPTRTPRATATPVPTAGPTARLQAAAEPLTNAQASLTGDMGLVEYEPSNLTEHLFLVDFANGFRKLAPEAFAAVPEMNVLTVRGQAEFTDKYGNATKENAILFTITRGVAAKVNWQNIQSAKVGPLLASEEGCAVYVHPALRPAWQEYTK